MSYRRHLEACNRFEPAHFLPLTLAGRRVGFIRQDNGRALEAFPHIFCLSACTVAIADTIGGSGVVTAAMAEAGAACPRRSR